MKYAKHIESGKIISAEDARYEDFYGIFLCPECKETLTLRKGYFHNGIEISSTFVHPSLDNSESCSQRKNWGVADNSFDGKPLSQGQLRSLLQKNIVDAICHYYLWWDGNPSNFNYIGKTDLHGLNITQAKTKMNKFFQTEGEFTKEDAEKIRKTEEYVYGLQSESINSTGRLTLRQILDLSFVPSQFHQFMSISYRQFRKYDESSDYFGQQITEARLKGLEKFIESSKIILTLPNNIVFVRHNINSIKSEAFSGFDKENPILIKHFDLVLEVASFLFSSAKPELIYKLTPYFITYPYQRRLKDTNSHWKEYRYCLEQVEEVLGISKSKINQFYYIFNHNDARKYPLAENVSKYVSYLLLNVVNILVYIDWISWFAKWQS